MYSKAITAHWQQEQFAQTSYAVFLQWRGIQTAIHNCRKLGQDVGSLPALAFRFLLQAHKLALAERKAAQA